MGKNDKSFSLYRSNAINKGTTNICSYFLDRCITLADYVALILPKYVLNNPEFIKSRQYLSKKCVDAVIDFGEKGFRGVLVETIALHIDNKRKPNITKVISYTHKIELSQKQSYICCPSFPYWIIYRNEEFDAVCRKMDFGVFSAFRDRQISKKHEKQQGEVRILKARNISDSGEEILDIPGYDAYIDLESAAQFAVYKYFNSENVYMTPNMTYYPRVMVKPKGTIANGSLAILTPIGDITPTANQLKYFSSKEYRIFYQIARNMQTRSLNIDSCSVYFFGLLRGETKSISKELDETQVCFLHEE
jgi:DNA (cytosine-5)-methyltransferase 1